MVEHGSDVFSIDETSPSDGGLQHAAGVSAVGFDPTEGGSERTEGVGVDELRLPDLG